jgi:opacity protein-like surface antigen
MRLPKTRVVPLIGRLVITGLGTFALLLSGAHAQAAPDGPEYPRKQTFGILAAYSDDSSHMLLGEAERRKLIDLGVSYNRRILAGRWVNWQYSGELLPVALEGDPLSRAVVIQTSPTATTTEYEGGPVITCAPVVTPYTYTSQGSTYSGTGYQFCHGRQWTIGTAMSPVGFQLNFLTRHAVQPMFSAHGGYMYTTRPIPLAFAGSFNFTFDFGVGLEVFRTRSQSVRAEYRYHHLSNHDTAYQNPGVDNGLFQLSYTFGR